MGRLCRTEGFPLFAVSSGVSWANTFLEEIKRIPKVKKVLINIKKIKKFFILEYQMDFYMMRKDLHIEQFCRMDFHI